MAKKPECNIDGLSSTLWLVKIPNFVAHQLNECSDAAIVGSLAISASTVNGNQTKQIKVTLTEPDGSKAAQEFSLEELSSTADQHLVPFVEDDQQMSYTLLGQVTKKLILKPKDSLSYREVVRDRSSKSAAVHETQAADPSALLGSRSSSHIVDFIPPAHAELKRRAQEQGGSRAAKGSKLVDTDLLRNKMFHAFSVNPRQSIKDLVTICKDVPGFTRDRELRDLLNTYARYHSKGTYHGFWELKPEYQDYTQRDNEKS